MAETSPGPKKLRLKIDGREYLVDATKSVTRTIVEHDRERHVEVHVPQTIYDAAKSVGIEIPILCHRDQLNLDGTPVPQAGVCRVCAVEVWMNGRPDRVFAAACCREIADGMEVKTVGKAQNGVDIEQTRRTLIELLLADHPAPCVRHREFHDCELELYAERYGLKKPVYTPRAVSKGTDFSNPSIAIDHSACILCDRCIRACAAVENHIIGRMGKGYASSISFDNNKPMGQSNCVNCGECMVACPTGAITYAGGKAPRPPEGVSMLLAEDLRKLPTLGPMFRRISPSFLKRSEGAVWARNFKKGEIICRQGEFGSTAFYIDSGEVDIYLDVNLGHLRTRKRSGGLFNRMSSLLFSREQDPRREERLSKSIPIDSSAGDLEYGRLVARVTAGELIGEAACLNFQPRSATVRAATDDVIVIEMLRNVLDMLRKTREFRADMERKYRERALVSHLRSVPIFRDLPEAFINRLRDRVSLLPFEPGQPIVTQGDPADAFYLIRMGHVKVYESYADGQVMVLSYLSRGQYF
ncbi:MAG: cyclic nucleotide-binding domain-containing protein, partial [Phycisphaerae bacterium]|nr:cyclic nucleotide-binding domain-containing protein [Phycisphaerae bacterium]